MDQAVDAHGGTEHSVRKKNGARLFLWEKRRHSGTGAGGTVVFVHGSSWASQPTFDLTVPGRPYSSVMDWFAARGYETWCFDAEGYGRSDKDGDGHFGIESGVEDLVAVTDYVANERAEEKVLLYGVSSGAIKAALFASTYPHRVSRLALDAFVWTGTNSPTLAERRKRLPELLNSGRRPFNRETIQAVFDRDHPGSADAHMIEHFANAALAIEDSVPNGTYIDMCSKLPMVQPEDIEAPTIVMRGVYDGVADIDDLYSFFAKLPNPDKHFALMPGIAHASFQQKNYLMVYHILLAFFSQPKPVFL
ncbi:MAG: alpha/beta hydrolase [Pseudorhodoplanes sp.]|uniref:alpha/beta hydrolase n=1 Tax=Pseudorhodoplanes sp. TaxID=1934341 RepID=UPI003D1288CC